MVLPELNQDNFGSIKISGFVLCFVLVAVLQYLFPYKRMNKLILENWRINLPLSLLNTLLISVICAGCACAWSLQMKELGVGLFNQYLLPFWVTILASVLVLDFVAYIWHRFNHRFSPLWRFHIVHHSDRMFDASTALRFHLGELLISLAVRLLIITVFGLSIAGILVFELVFQFCNILIHGNIGLPNRMEFLFSLVFVTPAHHRKHHSLKLVEINSNFGTIFSFWDRIGLSFQQAHSSEIIHTGVPQFEGSDLRQLLVRPFQKNE